jgi:hypothetical protein
MQTAPASVHQVLQTPGHSLDVSTRAFLEPRMGQVLGRTTTKPILAASSALPISQPGDAHEQEADQIADSVVAHITAGHQKSRQDSDPRYDLSHIRIHTDRRAAESARDVNALAYTVGQDIVFGEGLFSPGTSSGMHLLAHELAHTVQQNIGLARQPRLTGTHDPTPKFAPVGGCLGSEVCKSVTTPLMLLDKAEDPASKARRDERTKLCGKTPADPACRADGHAGRAVETEKLLNAYDAQRLKNAQGIFVDNDMEGSFGAYTTSCSQFTPPLASSGICIAVPKKMEENAKTFNTTTGPLVIDGKERGEWRERTLEILTHEVGHVDFRTAFRANSGATAASGAPIILGQERATCRQDDESRTNIFQSLNELAAMVQEFPLRMDRVRTSVNLSTPEAKEAELDTWRAHRIRGVDTQGNARKVGEEQSIKNSLRVVRCLCGCEDSNDMIKQTIDSATAPWNQNQKNDLNREMNNPKWKDLDLRWPYTVPPIPNVPSPVPERTKVP